MHIFAAGNDATLSHINFLKKQAKNKILEALRHLASLMIVKNTLTFLQERTISGIHESRRKASLPVIEMYAGSLTERGVSELVRLRSWTFNSHVN